MAGRPAIPVLAPQFIAQYSAALSPHDVGVFVSQSGETKDVINAVEVSQKKGMDILGLVNVIGSTLMRVSDISLPLACGYEISVPATKTFTNQIIAFLYLALRMGNVPPTGLANLPELMEQALTCCNPQIEALKLTLEKHTDLYCLGFGSTYPIALESALKLKEITYAHCEGMLSTEFKHGPLSAVTDGYPVLFIAGPQDVPIMVSGINEVTCRGGQAVVVAQEDSRLMGNASELIILPDVGPLLFPLISILPMQLLSYHLSVALGLDPDFPRNLSKTLTVD